MGGGRVLNWPLAVVACLLVVLLVEVCRPRPERRRSGDGKAQALWAGRTLGLLARAWADLGIEPAPRLSTPGRQIRCGIEWEIAAHPHPIGLLAEKQAQLESAVNVGGDRCARIEIVERQPGRGVLRALEREPLAEPVPFWWQPGTLPAGVASPLDPLIVGVLSDGSPLGLPLWTDVGGARHALFVGQNGSGKTRWVRTILHQALALDAEIWLVDSPIKGFLDYAVEAGREESASNPIMVPASHRALSTEAKPMLKDLMGFLGTLPTWRPGMRPRLLILDELRVLINAGTKAEVLALVSQVRAKGLSICAAIQLAEVTDLGGTTGSAIRSNFHHTLVGKLENTGQYRASGVPVSPGFHLPRRADGREIPLVGVASVSEGWPVVFGGLWEPDGWAAAHWASLDRVSTAAR